MEYMEELVVGIMMLLSFALGAYTRQPFTFFNKKEKEWKEPVYEPHKNETIAIKDDAEVEEEKRRKQQMENLWKYSEKDALNNEKDD